ncbi:MAG TPA: aa3-type cytochrome c oxidase subunit IV [Rhodobacteraceae bacterium]|nr:aa3-type cytochrome c oxidase subunit IV [Paracoccaceae bacterium]
MSEHEQGSMGIREHEKTFEGFVKFVTRAVIAIAIFLILLAIFNS